MLSSLLLMLWCCPEKRKLRWRGDWADGCWCWRADSPDARPEEEAVGVGVGTVLWFLSSSRRYAQRTLWGVDMLRASMKGSGTVACLRAEAL